MIRFFLSCVPPKTSHHAKHIVRIGKFSRLADDKELVAAKAFLEELLLPHQIPAPVPSPVILQVDWVWPFRASDSKKFRAPGLQPCDVKPDCSNVLKTLEDRLKALRFITDDACIVEGQQRKWFGHRPGIHITIAPWSLALDDEEAARLGLQTLDAGHQRPPAGLMNPDLFSASDTLSAAVGKP